MEVATGGWGLLKKMNEKTVQKRVKGKIGRAKNLWRGKG